MFDFLRRIGKQARKQLITYEYDEKGIYFLLDSIALDQEAIELYKQLFEKLEEEEFGELVENFKLSIDHIMVYDLLKDDRASFFPFPPIFAGNMDVKHRGFLDQDALFDVAFVLDDELIFNPQVVGTVLKKSDNEHYLLNEAMYISYLAIQKANKSDNAALRYAAIETMQSFEEERVYYKGLREDDIVHNVGKLGIDIVEHQSGDIDIYPLIPGLETEYIIKNSTTIANHPTTNLVLTHVDNDKIVRYVLNEKQLRSAKSIVKQKTIPKSQADKFKTNPELFFSKDDTEAIDFSKYRLIRVTGLRSEPYIGFFGSVKIETPMSQVLAAGDDVALIDKEQVTAMIEGLDDAQREKLKNEIEKAKETNEEVISYDDFEVLPVKVVEPILNSIEALPAYKVGKKQKNSKFLEIDSNDEKKLGDSKNSAVSIKPSNEKKSREWANISLAFEPKRHQVIGFNWLKTLYENEYKGGLLADDMGLGKTFQIVAFINYLYNTTSKPLESTSHRILIVAPSILLTSWKNEIENIVIDKQNFRVKILRGKNSALDGLGKAFLDGPERGKELALNSLDVIDLLRYNIHITTYETLSSYQLAFAHKELFGFEVCVFDEAQKIKNPNARITQAAKGISANVPFTILATGTPIENELRDLWSLFDAFDPVYIGPWKTFREKFVKPMNNQEKIKDIERELREKIGDYMLRRLKKDHLEGLPLKEVMHIDVPMSNDEIDKHKRIVNSSMHHMEKLQKLRVMSLHPDLVELEGELTFEEFYRFSDPENFFKPSKLKKLISLLNSIEQKQEKVLIFVIRHIMQTFLQSALEKQYGINVEIINGKNNNQNIVDRKLESFEKKDGFNILILSPLAAGVGLTITAANHVVHLERHWNPAKEDQASDRVYRIGQKKDVHIYHLVHSADENIKTFDQGLNELINKKKSLSDGTLIPTPSVKDSEIIETFFGKLDSETKWDLMSPAEFEIEVMRLFEKNGYRCHLTSKVPTESGADIVAIKNDKTFAIQCKHTCKKKKQGREAIRQLITEAKITYPRAEMVAVTNHYFNDNARKLATHHGVELIEKDKLVAQTL